MKIPDILWRVKTIKRTDDVPGQYSCNSIDHIVFELDDALAESYRRLSGNKTLEVSISKQEMTERYRKMYETQYERKEEEKNQTAETHDRRD